MYTLVQCTPLAPNPHYIFAFGLSLSHFLSLRLPAYIIPRFSIHPAPLLHAYSTLDLCTGSLSLVLILSRAALSSLFFACGAPTSLSYLVI